MLIKEIYMRFKRLRIKRAETQPTVVEKKTKKDECICIICTEKKSNCATVPCGHLICCDECYMYYMLNTTSYLCPICRSVLNYVDPLIRVYGI